MITVEERLAALEERMETKQAQYRTDFASMMEAMERHRGEYRTGFADLAAEVARHTAAAERRDKENVRWMAAFVIGAALLVIAVLKF